MSQRAERNSEIVRGSLVTGIEIVKNCSEPQQKAVLHGFGVRRTYSGVTIKGTSLERTLHAVDGPQNFSSPIIVDGIPSPKCLGAGTQLV
jgi:hypothetical protein